MTAYGMCGDRKSECGGQISCHMWQYIRLHAMYTGGKGLRAEDREWAINSISCSICEDGLYAEADGGPYIRLGAVYAGRKAVACGGQLVGYTFKLGVVYARREEVCVWRIAGEAYIRFGAVYARREEGCVRAEGRWWAICSIRGSIHWEGRCCMWREGEGLTIPLGMVYARREWGCVWRADDRL